MVTTPTSGNIDGSSKKKNIHNSHSGSGNKFHHFQTAKEMPRLSHNDAHTDSINYN